MVARTNFQVNIQFGRSIKRNIKYILESLCILGSEQILILTHSLKFVMKNVICVTTGDNRANNVPYFRCNVA